MFNSQLVENAREKQLHNATVEFIEYEGMEHLKRQGQPYPKPLIILDHIPFHKSKGNCVDSPHIEKDDDGYIKTQTMLSLKASHSVLKFSPTWIFNGHDHNGCFYQHKLNNNATVTNEYVVCFSMNTCYIILLTILFFFFCCR